MNKNQKQSASKSSASKDHPSTSKGAKSAPTKARGQNHADSLGRQNSGHKKESAIADRSASDRQTRTAGSKQKTKAEPPTKARSADDRDSDHRLHKDLEVNLNRDPGIRHREGLTATENDEDGSLLDVDEETAKDDDRDVKSVSNSKFVDNRDLDRESQRKSDIESAEIERDVNDSDEDEDDDEAVASADDGVFSPDDEEQDPQTQDDRIGPNMKSSPGRGTRTGASSGSESQPQKSHAHHGQGSAQSSPSKSNVPHRQESKKSR